MSPKKVELYEIIANRLNEGDAPGLPPIDSSYEIPLPNPARRLNAREVVLSLDAAFVIFVIFLLLLGTAYFLGVQKGEQQAKQSFTTAATLAVPTAVLEDLQATRSPKLEPVAAITIPEGRYTLRLTESNSKSEIQKLKKELLANATIRNYKVDVFVFAIPSPQGGESFVLTLGSFGSQNDETMARFQRFFKEQNNAKFEYTFPELVDDLKRSGKMLE